MWSSHLSYSGNLPSVQELLANFDGEEAVIPPLWRLIYDESIYENYLLFDKNVIARAREGDDTLKLEGLSSTFYQLWMCASLSDMRNLLKPLSVDEKVVMFRFHCILLKRLGCYIRSLAH